MHHSATARRRLVRTGLVVLALVLAAGLAAVPAAADVPTAPPRIPARGLLLGASVEAQGTLNFRESFAALETRLGRTLAIDRSFSRWDDEQPSWLVADDLADGRVPLLSISALKRDDTRLSWAAIAAGTFDPDIVRQATALRNTGKPILLAFQHEADLQSGYGSAADFRAAYQHYVTVFRQQGASNVAFVLILTPYAYTDAATWYPGADYVDWLGTDAYNWGSCKAGYDWHPLDYIVQPFYDWAVTTGKPLVLAEWGSAEDVNDPQRRAQWLTDAAETLRRWPAIKAAAYFDRVGTCDWRLGLSGPSADAFAALARSPLANGRPTAGAIPTVAVGPAPLATVLDLSRSTGGDSPTGAGVAKWTLDFGDGSAPASGKGQPTQVPHTYPAGTWTATLSVTDAAGRIAGSTAAVVAASPPTIAQADPRVKTTDTATVPGWIDTRSLVGSYYVQWGTTKAYGLQSTTGTLPAKAGTQAVLTTLTGLVPGQKYHWRTVAMTASGTAYGNDRTFTQ